MPEKPNYSRAVFMPEDRAYSTITLDLEPRTVISVDRYLYHKKRLSEADLPASGVSAFYPDFLSGRIVDTDTYSISTKGLEFYVAKAVDHYQGIYVPQDFSKQIEAFKTSRSMIVAVYDLFDSLLHLKDIAAGSHLRKLIRKR